MSLVTSKCPSCGGEIQLDNEKEKGFCLYCGSQINIQKTLNLSKPNITGSEEDVKKWEKVFEVYMKNFDYEKAEQIADKILQAQPDQDSINRCNMLKTAHILKINHSTGELVGVYSDNLNGQPKLVIPPGIKSISYNAFDYAIVEDDDDLDDDEEDPEELYFPEIVIPDGVIVRDTIVNFTKNDQVTKITFLPQKSSKIIDNQLVLSKDGKKLLYFLEDKEPFNIPEGVEEIGNYAFQCRSLDEIIIPEGVIKIGDCAFEACQNLKRITLPKTLQFIGNNTFRNCGKLEEIIIPDNVIKIGYNAFKFCKSLFNVGFPKIMKMVSEISEDDNKEHFWVDIEGCVFSGCENLTNIELPENLTFLSGRMFENCTNLSNIKLPEKIESIYNSAFQGCINLSKLHLPNTIKEISYEVFKGCVNLSEINLPDTIEKIGERAFLGCVSLKKINIPYNLKEIEEEAFRDCTELRSVIIPENTKKIKERAFWGCTSLISANIPSHISKNLIKPAYLLKNPNAPTYAIRDNEVWSIKEYERWKEPSKRSYPIEKFVFSLSPIQTLYCDDYDTLNHMKIKDYDNKKGLNPTMSFLSWIGISNRSVIVKPLREMNKDRSGIKDDEEEFSPPSRLNLTGNMENTISKNIPNQYVSNQMNQALESKSKEKMNPLLKGWLIGILLLCLLGLVYFIWY